MPPPLDDLPPRPDGAAPDGIHVVVETPRGSRNKLVFVPRHGAFRLRRVLPLGTVFPFDFGFVPGTLADDGDPLDVLVLMDDPTHPGVLVEARLLGVLEAEQQEGDGPLERNDRLVAVAVESPRHGALRTLDELGARTLDEIEHFFRGYTAMAGKRLRFLGRADAARAAALVARRQAR